VQEALALCVGCKGCKRDCPTGVDMARMKIEATARRKAVRGFTPADRCIGGCRRWRGWRGACRGCRTCATASGCAVASATLARHVGEALAAGVAARHASTASRRRSGSPAATRQLAAAKAVVLFVDTFNGNFETENAVAAVRVLQAAATRCTSRAADGGELCCGRTLLAAGMAEQAEARPSELLAACCRSPSAASPIVGLEPSCLLTLRDEIQVMGLGDAAPTVGARRCCSRSSSSAKPAPAASRRAAPPATDPGARPLPPEGVRHRAQGAGGAAPHPRRRADADRELVLRHGGQLRLRGRALRDIDGDGRAQPAAGGARAPDALVVADGTSCRHQIADGAGARAPASRSGSVPTDWPERAAAADGVSAVAAPPGHRRMNHPHALRETR
jgi:ferredoxin